MKRTTITVGGVALGAWVCATLLGGCGAPNQQGPAPATWELLDPDSVNAESASLRVGVTRLDCSGGETGTLLEPQVSLEADRILIRTDVAALPGGAYDCPGNNVVPLDIELGEAIGDRELVDQACLEGEAVQTTFCPEGGVRWR